MTDYSDTLALIAQLLQGGGTAQQPSQGNGTNLSKTLNSFATNVGNNQVTGQGIGGDLTSAIGNTYNSSTLGKLTSLGEGITGL